MQEPMLNVGMGENGATGALAVTVRPGREGRQVYRMGLAQSSGGLSAHPPVPRL